MFMGFPTGYDYLEFETSLVISVKTGQKVRGLLFSWRGVCLMVRVAEFNGRLLARE
jgi:hypothetical protein